MSSEALINSKHCAAHRYQLIDKKPFKRAQDWLIGCGLAPLLETMIKFSFAEMWASQHLPGGTQTMSLPRSLGTKIEKAEELSAVIKI